MCKYDSIGSITITFGLQLQSFQASSREMLFLGLSQLVKTLCSIKGKIE